MKKSLLTSSIFTSILISACHSTEDAVKAEQNTDGIEFSKEGITINDLRIVAFPFHDEVNEFIEKHDQIFIVEQNRDAQMKILIVNELSIDPNSLHSVLHYNSDPIDAQTIHDQISAALETASSSLAKTS